MYQWLHYYFPTKNYLFNVINKNIRAWCKTCPKLTIKTSELRPGRQFHNMFRCFRRWLGATNYLRGYFFQAKSVLQVVNVRWWILFNIVRYWNQTMFKLCAWRVHLVDSLWFYLVLDGFGQFQIILWFLLFMWFLFFNYIKTI